MRWETLTWEEISALRKAGTDTALLPVGATEQHGPHLGVGMDSVNASLVAEAVSAITRIPTLPCIKYGCSLGHSRRWPGTIALQKELRQQGFKTFIFSNTNDLAIEHVRRNFPFFKDFDGYIFSYEVGGMKPQPEIYAAMEAMTGKRGADLIYIDDRRENIEAGLARGWRAIWHESPEKTRQALIAFGVI